MSKNEQNYKTNKQNNNLKINHSIICRKANDLEYHV